MRKKRPVWELVGKEIVFTLKAPENAVVQIAGDFNNWIPEELQLTDTPSGPRWKKNVWLRRGSYQYKYLLDGVWITDPTNLETVENPYGNQNSLIKI
jgi:1,4-alpha-glucan branching enzyme